MNSPDEAPTSKCRLVVVGSNIRGLVGGEHGFGNYADVIADYPDLESWLGDAAPLEADLVVAGCPTLFEETVERIRVRLSECGAARAVLVYEFAKAEIEAAIAGRSRELTALRAPVTAAELRAACEADIALAMLRGRPITGAPVEQAAAPAPPAEIPARQFSDAQLAQVAEISTAIDCECPHHLATLLTSLNAFERYSRECENRNDEDALLHAYLHRSTAKARAMIEEALAMLAEAEGFDLG